jgi:hypothetical protein
MAANRKGRSRGGGRVAGGFVALPWQVLDSPAWQRLSYPAKALALEVARQYVRDNNGSLLCSRAYLLPRGWNSNDVIHRGLIELLEAGFLHQTVMGQRPNKASWYAITWQPLDPSPKYDAGAAELFVKAKYLTVNGDANASRTHPKAKPIAPAENASLRPSDGVGRGSIAPADGVGGLLSTPPNGAVRAHSAGFSTPPNGHHLELPSARVVETGADAYRKASGK